MTMKHLFEAAPLAAGILTKIEAVPKAGLEPARELPPNSF